MSGWAKGEKVREWTERLRRFEKADQTVAAFCQAESVSEPAFYCWRKKLRAKPVAASASFQPVHVATRVAESDANTVIELGKGVRIQLGSDLVVVQGIMKQVLAAALEHESAGDK